MTLHKAIQKLRTLLIGIYPEHEANSIAHYYFECKTRFSRIELYANRQMEIEWDELKCDIARLTNHEPVQYVTGVAWFCGFQLNVTKDVLVPRPETEELVQNALEIVKSYFQRLHPELVPNRREGGPGQKVAENDSQNYKILDIGTGSGCIAIAIKKLFPQAEVYASDFSETAIKIAKHNAEKNGADINFINDDILQSSINGNFDMIISNPPYVTDKEKMQMEKNVLEFEPHSALFVPDNDAMKFYSAISLFAKTHLNPDGHILFEINEAYNNEVCSLLKKADFINIESLKDINDKWRIVKAQKA